MNSSANQPEPASALPYTDTKPVGAADFYFGINATFRFILAKFGLEGLRRYWSEMGASYFRPVSERWRAGGMRQVAAYWRAFFAAEPGADVEVQQVAEDEVRIEVRACPAIKHLRAHGRAITPCYCQHCYYVSEAIAEPAGMTVRISGGNGACKQRFLRREPGIPPQNLNDIREAA